MLSTGRRLLATTFESVPKTANKFGGTRNLVGRKYGPRNPLPLARWARLKSLMYPTWTLALGPGFIAVVIWRKMEGKVNFITSGHARDADLSPIKAEIEALLDEDDNLGPTLVRLAWHASGTYSKEDKSGGSNGGRMRYNPEKGWGANAGLQGARDAMDKIHQKYPGLSVADLWIYSGAVAIEYMGGPNIPFKTGRIDEPDGSKSPPDGRLPAADMGQVGKTIRHVRDIFYRMGFNDKEIVALLGAHAIGRCHTNASGYDGPWTRGPTTFSNEYYKELLDRKWTLRNWDGPDQFEDESGALMMLPADMALLWDKKFRAQAELYAANEGEFFKDFRDAWVKLTELGCQLN